MINSSGKSLGDLDSLFKVEDPRSASSAVVLVVVERKTTVNFNAKQTLLDQIKNTAMALRSKLDEDEKFCEKLGLKITDPPPIVHSALFCEAGDDRVLESLLDEGIIVFTNTMSTHLPLRVSLKQF